MLTEQQSFVILCIMRSEKSRVPIFVGQQCGGKSYSPDGLRILARIIARCCMERKLPRALKHDNHSDSKSALKEVDNELWHKTNNGTTNSKHRHWGGEKEAG